ncbi:hypothetical protein COW94_03075 [Candidatus Peregrinibacteria bacterium CG22_combo_CG10-13_8_21_14_all_44_10]|nr:MAG: hypothetical protein COW94_03075 [Candidatus Peregrinibacteria bacterium CG22_combo_CG10-13_8_21_14_all_44_10]PIS03897.1 MAG: hypothetical protein COT83_03585 [Candidatus Peregrinibacteria bacterium CG10_big_fil_rev_8_21_14_0_10_44_7]PIX79992.1 MAG: hypothetical protein COZ35_02070 [Candidatus Peregrinibacteria bacterium CG_4_10_14_3_um_filter_44_21]PJB88983.1 MAG: hypothetical protein CO082_02685 [Candidatus Peregrinibacteria bacterium CG_4_9_14_0_8_um_filter_44_15]
MTYIYGAHMSISDGFVSAIRSAHDSLGANAMQIFLKSPRGRFKSKLTAEEAAEVKKYSAEVDFKYIVVHCSYLLNFAKDVSKDRWALDSLIDDLRGAEMIGASGVVLHVGKHLDLEYTNAFKLLIPNLKTVLAETSDLKAKIILENTAGQGTEMGRSFEEIAAIVEALKSDRVKACLDTCHSFAWGYDWSDSEAVFEEFARVIGLDRLDVIHFNDSLKSRLSRVDRHANLDSGEIGGANLKSIAHAAGKHSVPIILETPERDGRTHVDDMKILKSWMT